MKTLLIAALVLVAAVAGFVAGTRRGSPGPLAAAAAEGRKILYYVDPMNPTHTSDKPGLAPCGMKLEPVYAAEGAATATPGNGARSLPEGTVKVNPEKQQLLGIRAARVETQAPQHRLRLLGKVVLDERRDYSVHAPTGGWITRTLPWTTGDLVKKDEVLAGFYSADFTSLVQSLVAALTAQQQTELAGQGSDEQIRQLLMEKRNLERTLAALQELGMSQHQIAQIARTGHYTTNVDIISPADGFITARHVADGLRLEKGMELFRVANLSRVWILADVFTSQGESPRPGSPARVTVPGRPRSFSATVSQALPQYDSGSRTLKVRFEADNPDYALRPDMLVDVEVSVTLPEMIAVAADAVLDSGLSQTVFVDQGSGCFEPRQVKTGRRFGDLVEIVHGLTAGERIVTAGNFMLDSESRMKRAAAAQPEPDAKDPVCGMTVDPAEARSSNLTTEHEGKTYSFCSANCKRRFDAAPQLGLSASTRASEHPQSSLERLPN
jgi:membrane fusion protein, copper/silver efflux system